VLQALPQSAGGSTQQFVDHLTTKLAELLESARVIKRQAVVIKKTVGEYTCLVIGRFDP